MSKAPAFQFYAADFLIGTFDMTAEQVGVYIRLLAFSWDKGPLPKDTRTLASMAGLTPKKFQKAWEKVQEKWTETDAGWVNDRLEVQRKARDKFSQKQAENGKKGAAKRWARHSHRHDVAIAKRCPKDSSSVFSLLSSEDQERDQAEERDLAQERDLAPERGGRRLTPLPSPQSLVEAWNSGTTAPIPKCKELTPKRRTHALARLRDAPIDTWRDVIARIEASAFCRGQNDRGWVATFDWLLQPETRVKVLEGKYDNRAPTLVPSGGRAVDKTTRALEAAQIAIARHRASGGN